MKIELLKAEQKKIVKLNAKCDEKDKFKHKVNESEAQKIRHAEELIKVERDRYYEKYR